MSQFVISDIHGNLKTFEALLKRIDFRKKDELFILGDYIDRGPDSKGVIDTIFRLRKEGYTLHCLKGNHEEALLKSREDQEQYHSWLHWGGSATLKSFNTRNWTGIPAKYWDFFESLDLYFEVDRYILVHAGLNFDTPTPLENKHSMMWIRNWYEDINYKWLGDRIVIHGHTPVGRDKILKAHKDLDKNQVIDIDNGCFVDFKPGMGNLCAMELDSHLLMFQPRLD